MSPGKVATFKDSAKYWSTTTNLKHLKKKIKHVPLMGELTP
jgi:hypothetical protein